MNSISYKALVLNKVPFGLEVEEFKLNPKTKHAKMIYSGMCGTDKHAIKGELDLKLPAILGHENVGEIDGERFTWPTIIPCNKCKYCKKGLENICTRNLLFGITTTNPLTGGWAEYTHIPKDIVLFKIPDSLRDDAAVLIESLASTKVLRRVKLEGKRILIIGSGTIGLLSAIHAKHRGASEVAITGHREQASLIGKVIDTFYEKDTPIDELHGEFDIVLDAGGNENSVKYSIGAIKHNGIILESACLTKGINVDVSTLVEKEATIYTQLGYIPADFIWAIRMVEENQRLMRKIITHRFRLTEYKKMIEVVKNVNHGKLIFSLV